jgi:hypothetical protein
MGVVVKNVLRAVLVLAFLFTSQFGYGLSFDGLLGGSAHIAPLPEPASLVVLGLAMLLFANGARRRPVASERAVTAKVNAAPQKNALVAEPQGYAA